MKLRTKIRAVSVTCPSCDLPVELPITTSWPQEPYRKHGDGPPTIVVTLTADPTPLSEHLLTHGLVQL
jgi:hypothetical protein